jgi:hypothetical protein
LLDCWECGNPIGTISSGNPSHSVVRAMFIHYEMHLPS